MGIRLQSQVVALTLTLLSVCAVAQGELTIQRVFPQRIYCTPGETQQFEIAVANPDATAASAQLVVSLVRDLDTTLPLLTEPFSVEPGQTKTWTVPWKAEPWLGIEVRAALLRDGQALTTKSDYFTCARTIHARPRDELLRRTEAFPQPVRHAFCRPALG